MPFISLAFCSRFSIRCTTSNERTICCCCCCWWLFFSFVFIVGTINWSTLISWNFLKFHQGSKRLCISYRIRTRISELIVYICMQCVCECVCLLEIQYFWCVFVWRLEPFDMHTYVPKSWHFIASSDLLIHELKIVRGDECAVHCTARNSDAIWFEILFHMFRYRFLCYFVQVTRGRLHRWLFHSNHNIF